MRIFGAQNLQLHTVMCCAVIVQLCIKNAYFRVHAEILLICADKFPFLGSVQKYFYPGTMCPWILVQRAIFGVRAEILIFGEIFTSVMKDQVLNCQNCNQCLKCYKSPR